MKLGLENKKQLIWLSLLAVVLIYVLWSNVFAPSNEAAASRPARTDPRSDVPAAEPPQSNLTARMQARAQAGRPATFKVPGNTKLDPATIDPTLRLDLIAKVQSVNLAGGERNIFQFGAAPMPKTPDPKIVLPPKPEPQPGPDTPAPPPPKPPPPPIPLKFYGYSQARPGEKRAFFLDGEEIIVAAEGATIKGRYKVVRIGIDSVTVEDTQYNHQQTLPLEPEPMG